MRTTKHLSIFLNILFPTFHLIKFLFIGQAYDGANSMRGQYNGLRTLIQRENSNALYVWCYAHIINLVIVDMCDCSAVSSIQDLIILNLHLKKLNKFQCFHFTKLLYLQLHLGTYTYVFHYYHFLKMTSIYF